MYKLITVIGVLIFSTLGWFISGVSIYFILFELIDTLKHNLTIDAVINKIGLLVIHSSAFIIITLFILLLISSQLNSPLVGKSRLPINRRKR